MPTDHEILVVGAGPAGLGAAMALARLGRSVLLCDDDRPRNAPAEHMHNFAGEEGVPPREWREKATRDVMRYPSVEIFKGSVNSVEKREDSFQATLSSNRTVRAKKVILAYGIKDRLPPIPGLEELWGKSVFHCPFCHGFEHKDGKIGVIADGAKAMYVLSLLSGLTADLVIFTNGRSELSVGQRAILDRRGVRVIESPIERIVQQNGALQGVLAGGRLHPRTAILVAGLLPYEMKSGIGEQLGSEKTELGLYKIGEGNRTTVPGVYAAGDNMSPMQSVLAACAAGQVAGAAAAMDLLQESFNA